MMSLKRPMMLRSKHYIFLYIKAGQSILYGQVQSLWGWGIYFPIGTTGKSHDGRDAWCPWRAWNDWRLDYDDNGRNMNGPTAASSPLLLSYTSTCIYLLWQKTWGASRSKQTDYHIISSSLPVSHGVKWWEPNILFIQAFVPQERNPEVMTIRAYSGAEGTSGSLPL